MTNSEFWISHPGCVAAKKYAVSRNFSSTVDFCKCLVCGQKSTFSTFKHEEGNLFFRVIPLQGQESSYFGMHGFNYFNLIIYPACKISGSLLFQNGMVTWLNQLALNLKLSLSDISNDHHCPCYANLLLKEDC